MKRIKERKGAGPVLGIEDLTQDRPRPLMTRITDADRFASEILPRWCLIDVAGGRLPPIRVDQLIEELPSTSAGR